MKAKSPICKGKFKLFFCWRLKSVCFLPSFGIGHLSRCNTIQLHTDYLCKPPRCYNFKENQFSLNPKIVQSFKLVYRQNIAANKNTIWCHGSYYSPGLGLVVNVAYFSMYFSIIIHVRFSTDFLSFRRTKFIPLTRLCADVIKQSWS